MKEKQVQKIEIRLDGIRTKWRLRRDGGKGSGNWGHAGRPGKVGGSQKNPESAFKNRYVDAKSGAYTSFAKEKKKAATPHQPSASELQKLPIGSRLIDGKDIYEKIDSGTGENTKWRNLYTGEIVGSYTLNKSKLWGKNVKVAIPASAESELKGKINSEGSMIGTKKAGEKKEEPKKEPKAETKEAVKTEPDDGLIPPSEYEPEDGGTHEEELLGGGEPMDVTGSTTGGSGGSDFSSYIYENEPEDGSSDIKANNPYKTSIETMTKDNQDQINADYDKITDDMQAKYNVHPYDLFYGVVDEHKDPVDLIMEHAKSEAEAEDLANMMSAYVDIQNKVGIWMNEEYESHFTQNEDVWAGLDFEGKFKEPETSTGDILTSLDDSDFQKKKKKYEDAKKKTEELYDKMIADNHSDESFKKWHESYEEYEDAQTEFTIASEKYKNNGYTLNNETGQYEKPNDGSGATKSTKGSVPKISKKKVFGAGTGYDPERVNKTEILPRVDGYKMFMPATVEQWSKMTAKERKYLYKYTTGSRFVNEPLGERDYWASSTGKKDTTEGINAITKALNRCSIPEDCILSHGIGNGGFKAMFQIGDYENIEDAVNARIGQIGLNNTFFSCTADGGNPLSKPIVMDIFVPKGAKGMYVEPFSSYGLGAKSASWDGSYDPDANVTDWDVSHENEVILQRGGMYKITGYEWKDGEHHVICELVNQDTSLMTQEMWEKHIV